MTDTNKTPPPIMVKGDSITVVTDKGPRIVRRGQPNFEAARAAIKEKDWDKLVQLLDVKKAVQSFGSGRVEIRGDELLFDGAPLRNYLVTKIFAFMEAGLPIDNLTKFLERLQGNPSMRAREELYKFLETEDLPITEDGHFLAYKAVRADWMDKHSGRINNAIGRVVEMPRDQVDDNQTRGCSRGLHAGSLSYVESFGNRETGDRFLLVKIDPADVVCIPNEDCRKLRCCRYEVVNTFDTAMVGHVYDSAGQGPVYSPSFYDEGEDVDVDDWYDDDYEDDDLSGCFEDDLY